MSTGTGRVNQARRHPRRANTLAMISGAIRPISPSDGVYAMFSLVATQ